MPFVAVCRKWDKDVCRSWRKRLVLRRKHEKHRIQGNEPTANVRYEGTAADQNLVLSVLVNKQGRTRVHFLSIYGNGWRLCASVGMLLGLRC